MAQVRWSNLPEAAGTPDADDTLMFSEDGTPVEKVVATIFEVAATPLADGAIHTAAIDDGVLDSEHLADDAVTTAKLSSTAANATTLAHTAVTPGAFTTSITVDAQGRVTAGSSA